MAGVMMHHPATTPPNVVTTAGIAVKIHALQVSILMSSAVARMAMYANPLHYNRQINQQVADNTQTLQETCLQNHNPLDFRF